MNLVILCCFSMNAGTFTMDRDHCHVPCLFYATFNNRICVHYNVRLKQIGTSNLFEAVERLCATTGVECPGKGRTVWISSTGISDSTNSIVLTTQCQLKITLHHPPFSPPWLNSSVSETVIDCLFSLFFIVKQCQ